MNKKTELFQQIKIFAVFAGLGLAAELNHVHIPYTDTLIDGRWAFGFMGFALLGQGWAALALAAVLSVPFGSEVPFSVGFLGNLLYAVPSLLVLRPAHGYLLRRWNTGWIYGLGWASLVIICYQAFTTPVVWGVTTFREGMPILPQICQGWREQPFLIESILTALFSATAMVAVSAHQHLRRQQKRLDHIYRVLLGIRNVNQLIVSEDNPRYLIETACVNLTETMGYLNAWIILLDKEGKSIAALSSSGFNGGFEAMSARLKSGKYPDCMKRALDRNEIIVIKNPRTDCPDCSLSPEYGTRAGLTRRLHFEDRTYGLLAVSVPAAYALDAEEQSHFEEIANDLAFALHKIETAGHLEESRRLSRRLFEKLQTSYAMLARTEQIARVGSWEWDIDKDHVKWSDQLFHMFQLNPEHPAPPFAEQSKLYVPEDMQPLQQAVEQCRINGTPYELELRAVGRDGRRFQCIARGQAQTDEKGRIHGLAGSLQDITRQKQDEAALRESEEKYRLLVENANELILVAQEGLLRFVNRKVFDFLGYPPEDLLGKPFTDYIHPEDRKKVAERHFKRMKGESLPNVYSFRIIDRSGNTKWIEISAIRIDWQGKPATLNFLMDITERKRSEDHIFLLGQMIDSAPASITAHDTSGRFLFANRRTLSLHGYDTEEEFLSINLHDLDAPESKALLKERFLQISEKGESRFEVEHFRRDGSLLPLEVQAKRIEWAGRPAVLSIATDITERKNLENQLRHSQKMEAVGRLAGGVAHDFNNMLGVILGRTELAMSKTSPEVQIYEDLQEIFTAARRSADITRQLLAFARKQTIAPKVIDLNKIIEGVLKMLGRIIGEDIELLWKPAENLWAVKMDPSQIDQILANLCVNAKDAISGVGKITIETDQKHFDEAYCRVHTGFIPGDFILLTVSDNGCGMGKETLSNLFEPFYTTKEMGKGTGLGLATVYGIVKQNNGFINVYSEPGQGTSFKIYLPRAHCEPEAQEINLSEEPAPHGSETILLVEDEPAILKMIQVMLERLGYAVLSAGTPLEALALAGDPDTKVHLLITDVVMPEMNGRDLAGRLASAYPDIKLLFMSGYTANVIAHQGVLDEGVAFIQKPFSIKDLARKVRQALENG